MERAFSSDQVQQRSIAIWPTCPSTCYAKAGEWQSTYIMTRHEQLIIWIIVFLWKFVPKFCYFCFVTKIYMTSSDLILFELLCCLCSSEWLFDWRKTLECVSRSVGARENNAASFTVKSVKWDYQYLLYVKFNHKKNVESDSHFIIFILYEKLFHIFQKL